MSARDVDFNIERVPPRLRALRRWVLVRLEWRKDPETGELIEREIHISFHSGRECGPDDPRNLASFEQVCSAWERWPDVFDGVAFALGWALHPDPDADAGGAA